MTTLDITRGIDIEAPVAKVWAAITEPELIAQWFGDSAEFDARPGGAGLFGWSARSIGPFRVLVEPVDEPKTLVYRWAREAGVAPAPGRSTLVRFDLAEIAGGTRPTVLETGSEELDDPRAAHEANSAGWGAELAELVELVESR